MIRIFHKLYHDLEIPTECELFRLWHLRQSSLLRSGTLRTEAEEWTGPQEQIMSWSPPLKKLKYGVIKQVYFAYFTGVNC